jgi:hypothetical protein
VSLDTVSVDVVITTTPVVVDAVLMTDVQAVDVTLLETPIVADVVVGPNVGSGGGGPTGMNGANGSVTPISPGTTAYIGVGWSITESKAEFLMLCAGNVTDFGISIGAQPLGTGSIVATLRKLGADTALTVTLSGSEQSEYVSGSVSFAKGDRAAIKAVLSSDVPGGIIITPSWRLVPT